MNAASAPVTIKNPYPGLRPFEPDEFGSFFGRDRQIDELLDKLRNRRFVAILGLSGSGKSSLVRAGLIHRLQVGHLTSAGSRWRIALVRPGSEPIEALAASLDETLGKQRGRAAQLRHSTQELLNSTRDGRNRTENLLLVVDQFEEVFRFQDKTQFSGRDAEHFVDLLLAVEQDLSPNYRVYVVLTMRTDYLGDCARFDGLPEALNRGQYLVPRLTREQMAEAIQGPAALADTEVASQLLQTLLVEAAEGQDSLSLLQHALTRMWERREPSLTGGWQITPAQYQTLGGMAKALNDYANRVLAELPPDRRELAKKIFQQLTEVGQGRDQRRPQRLGQLALRIGATLPEVEVVVEHFFGATLLTSPDRGHVPDWEVDITHESLVRQWDTLKGWATEEAQNRDDYLYFSKRVERGGEPLTGTDLVLALKWRDRGHAPHWADRYGGDFAATLTFIERSRKHLVKKKMFIVAVPGIALLAAAAVLLVQYRQYQVMKRQEQRNVMLLELERAKEQGVQLEKGRAIQQAIAQGLADAKRGDLDAAQGLFKLAGDTNRALPMEALEQAIADAQRGNNPALTNLRIARQKYVSSQGLLAVAMNARVLRSENGGNSWQAWDVGSEVDLWSVIFATRQSGWAAGESGTILHTEDGGRTWEEQASGTNVELDAITFVNEQSGWVAGQHGTILHTQDGGQYWRAQSSGVDASLLCFSFANQQSGWSAGSRGTILYTADGGNSWHQQRSPTNEVLRSLTFVTMQSGWAAGYDGTILHTEDGGNNWRSQTSSTSDWLFGVAFVSQQSGWAVGQHGTILHTEDGGEDWRAQSSGTNADLHAVSFLTSRSGWVAGDQGTILYTDDGGNNWQKQNSGSKALITSITLVGRR
jgi:photosystem II stability/assembly factor-like uncharacterized protein